MGKKQSLQESLERMKYVSKYVINESPVYKSLVGNGGMDALPEYLMKEADSGATANQPAPELPPLPATPDAGAPAPAPAAGGAAPAPTAAAPAPAPAPEGGADNVELNKNVDITTSAPAGEPAMEAPPMGGEPMESPEKKVMELQLDALKKMSYKIEDLGSAVDSLNDRMRLYSDEVEKVREPSDMEKFENRKNDSSPYYFNLNDLWKDDNFKSRMDQFGKGYVKTEDGYVADFDDLPKLAPHEVKASFDDY